MVIVHPQQDANLKNKPLFPQQRESLLYDSKENKLFVEVSSRRYANSYLKEVAGRLQTVRIRLPGGSTVQHEHHYKTNTEQGMAEEDRHWDTADREKTAGEGITMKNSGARILNREDKSLVYVV
jgi:hypothetical protein